MRQIAIAIFLTSITVLAADQVAKPHKLSDLHASQMVSQFRKVVNLQMQVQTNAMDLCKAEPSCAAKWQRYNAAVAEQNVLADKIAKEENLPPGTQFKVDDEKNEVDVDTSNAPKAPEANKP